jgi:Zn-dependent metalloprotease/chitodextrinase
MRIASLLGAFVICSINSIQAQIYTNSFAGKFADNAIEVRIDEKSQAIRYIKFSRLKSAKAGNYEAILSAALKFPKHYKLLQTKASYSGNNKKHIKYQVYINNIPAEFMVYNAHISDEQLISANGFYNISNNLDVSPSISETVAFETAKNAVDAEKYLWEAPNHINYKKPSGMLVYLPIGDKLYLAYKFDIYSTKPVSRQYIYVDANTGKTILKLNRLHVADIAGTAITRYSGTCNISTESHSGMYRLRESGRGKGIITLNLNNTANKSLATDFTDTDNFWDSKHNNDDAAYDVHIGTEKTFDYYKNTFGRVSYDGDSSALISYVHYGSEYINAFWDGSSMNYGDGDGVQFGPLTSTDIVAHEITHGVTEHSANLIYEGESGALNESFSDIFGVVVDFYANPTQANFLMGDQIDLLSRRGMRNMANPKEFKNPDTYKGRFWDSIHNEVHVNSGVQNYWFFLLCQGGSGVNDKGIAYNVSGIGMDKAAAIAYRTLTVYLTPNSTYADACYYSIKAAEDLYGACSSELKSVAKAWYAVGLENNYTALANAAFSADRTFSCTTPFTVNFINQSENASNLVWDFGDGSTSLQNNPSHVYLNKGKYTVSLKITGSGNCPGTDTLVKTDYIVVNNLGNLLVPACTPSILAPSAGKGIFNFEFAGIKSVSNGSIEGNADFTCSYLADVTQSKLYKVKVITSDQVIENVRVWIDYNNNGSFDNSELAFESINALQVHTGYIQIPENTTLNTPLRLRVVTDAVTPESCGIIQSGQAEDYTVFIKANVEPPLADFNVLSTLVPAGTKVDFINLTTNIIDSIIWLFPGGSPSVSNERMPVVNYNSAGEYDVTLIVKNSFGTDTITRRNFIQVLNSYTMCMDITSADEEGILYDSGSAGNNYTNNENCGFKIQVPCAQGYTLFFDSLQIENCCDRLMIYEGNDETGKLVFTSGSEIPDSILILSNKAFVKFISDGSVNYAGFKLRWKANVPPQTEPVANFDISEAVTPLFLPVKFTDLSTNGPVQWSWDFGDGAISGNQHPEHIYQTPGIKSVTLIANNCFFADTITRQITVQDSARVAISVMELSAFTSRCSDSISLPFYIYNKGNGDLVFSLEADSLVKSGTIGRIKSLDTANTLVHPGDSVQVDAIIITNGISSGNYNSGLTVKSNDPARPEVTIPIHFTVDGSATLTVSTAPIVYPGVFIGDSVLKLLPLLNSGCDTLFISSITCGNTSYKLRRTKNYLLPEQTDTLHLFFKPLDEGELSDTLKIVTNEGVALVYLSGKGLLPPVVSTSTSSVHLETLSCGDSVKFKLLIKNTGNALLKTKLSIAGQRQILADNFENSMNSSLWEAYDGVKIDSVCGSGEGRKACYFNGNASIRYLISKPLNTAYSSNAEFYVYSGDDVTCNTPEEGEELYFAYRKGSEEWVLLEAFDVNSYKSFEKITIALPESAKGSNVQFAWIQEYSSSGLFDVWAIDNINIYGADKEIDLTPHTLNVAPANEDTYNLTFKSAGLRVGEYNYSLNLATNDPVQRNIAIPATFVVKGQPAISLSNDTLFVQSMEGITSKRYFTLTNTGCDTLQVSAISNKRNVFSVDKSIFKLLPSESAEITVSFTPDTIADYSDTLMIYSNTNPVKMALTGEGTGVPVLSTLPGTIHFNATLCNLNAQIPVNIENVGNGALHYNIFAGAKRDSVYILSLITGADYNQEYKNTVTALKSKFKKVKITEFNSYDSVSFKGSLINNDVLLIPDQENINNSQYLKLVPAMHEFANKGGLVVFCGTDKPYISNSSFFAGDNYVMAEWNEVITADTSNVFCKNVSPDFYAQDASFGYAFTNADKVSPVTYYGYDVLTYRNVGSGRVFYLGFDFYVYDDNTSNLLANIVKSAKLKLQPVNWLNFSKSTGVLAMGVSQNIEVSINSNLQPDSVYECSLLIITNCPMHDTIIIPASVTVSGTPCSEFSSLVNDCGGEVHFTGTASHNPYKWEWDFGDGTVSSDITPVHKYNSNGEYSVRLVVSNSVKTDTVIRKINIKNIIAPEVIISDKRYTGDTIYFYELSGTASIHSWTFGDGNNSNLSNTYHIYNTPGKFEVVCTMGNEKGCTATDTVELTIDKLVDVNEIVPVRVTMYPNPNNGNFSIDITDNASKVYEIEIFDNSGKLVERKNNVSAGTLGVNLKGQAQGVYFVKVHSSLVKGVFSGKLVVK